jgi:hypothetical protein
VPLLLAIIAMTRTLDKVCSPKPTNPS